MLLQIFLFTFTMDFSIIVHDSFVVQERKAAEP